MINVTKKYLELSQFSHLNEDFEDLFQSHPNYPSLFAITDSFDTLSIEHIAVKVPKESLEQLPASFLTLFDKEMVLVTKTKSDILIKTEKGIKKNLSFNEFFKHWDPIILVIEPNLTKNSINKKINLSCSFYILSFIALISLSALYNPYNTLSVVVLQTSILGLIGSIFILQQNLGISNEMVSKICHNNLNISCESVIQSSKNKKWVNFPDLPFLFFSISTLLILINPQINSSLVGILSIFSIPIVLYSIFLQKFKLKKWCVLCLFISAILILQTLLFVFTTTSFFIVTNELIMSLILVTVLLITLWLYIKPILEYKINLEKEVLGLKSFKRSFKVFKFLSNEIYEISGFDSLQGIYFGNENAPLHLTIISSPSCGHCHLALEQAMEMVEKFPKKISLNILFNINPENNNNPYHDVVENLLSINFRFPEKIREAISDWHIKRMKLNDWLKKWKSDEIDNEIKNEIFQQYNWCVKNKFNYTPVKIFNGKLFPKEYNIDDLKYFINNFQKQESESTKSNLKVV